MKMIVQFAGLVLVLALLAPSLSRSVTASLGTEGDAPPGTREVQTRETALARPAPARPPAIRNGQARIRIGRDGHFRTDAKLNYRSVAVLVDTGASSVALPRSVAERIGIRLHDRDFRHTARTANGETAMAIATLERVEIGGVLVRDVEAAVLNDASLGTVLLGMSFLGKLRRFSVERGELVLVR